MKRIAFALGAILILTLSTCPQTYPPAISVPVTFYDFHSDGSCPDFNPGTSPQLWLRGMVQDTLDQNSLLLKGDSLLYSYSIGKWFLPWRQGNDLQRPQYNASGRILYSLNTVTYDTSYKNVVVNSNLTFTYVDGSAGQYTFQSGAFFPLDNSGFQTPPNTPDPTLSWNGQPLDRMVNTHNYSFAMHLKKKINYINGTSINNQPVFNFQGNDDMWVFINKKLVLDLGGIHLPVPGMFVLFNGKAYVSVNYGFGLTFSDTIDLGLSDGSTPIMDVFYCQRQAVNAGIVLTICTNPGPTLIAPANNTTDVSVTPILSWNTWNSTNPVTYEIQVSTDPNFATTVYDQSGLTATLQQISPALTSNTLYYWRVNATAAGVTSDFSAVWNFKTIAVTPGIPTLISPADGATGQSLTPTLSWNPVAGANSYELQVSTTSNFNSTVFDQSGITATSQVVSPALGGNATYYWRVNATNTGGTSVFSSPWSFTTLQAPPTAPSLVTPSNGATNQDTSLTFSWNASNGATSYEIQVSHISNFSSTVFDSTISGTSQAVSSLSMNTLYFWRAKASNTAGSSSYSTSWNFTTRQTPVMVIPKSFALRFFNLGKSSRVLHYELPEQCLVSLKYYNLKGRIVGSFVNQTQGTGVYTLPLPISSWAKGSYIQVFNAGRFCRKEIITIVD